MQESIVILADTVEAKEYIRFFAEHGIIVEVGSSKAEIAAEMIEDLFVEWDMASKNNVIEYKTVLFYKDHAIPRHMSRVSKNPIVVLDFIMNNEIPHYFDKDSLIFLKKHFTLDINKKILSIEKIEKSQFQILRNWFKTYNIFIDESLVIKDAA
ncbi:MAG: hypothetical protein H6622_09615 [Halobacteriovoraceae bacterium]|nr:hypothetical protein [Halobacteriovoraceae bacterium]